MQIKIIFIFLILLLINNLLIWILFLELIVIFWIQVDITLVNHYPHTHHKDNLMSSTAKLKVEVSALHAGQNGRLEISCRATIPDFPMHHEKFADIKEKMVSGKFS